MINKLRVLFNHKKTKLIGVLNKYTQKERVVMAIGTLFLSIGIFYALVVSYYSTKLKQTNIEKMNMRVMLLTNKEDIANVNKILQEPGTPEKLKTIETLKEQQKKLMDQLHDLNKISFTGAELSDLLYDLLLEIKTLKIVSFVSEEESMFGEAKESLSSNNRQNPKQTKPNSATNAQSITKAQSLSKLQGTIKPLNDTSSAKSGIVNPTAARMQNSASPQSPNSNFVAQDFRSMGPNGQIGGPNSNYWDGPNAAMGEAMNSRLVKQNYVLTLEGKYLDIYKYLMLIESKKLPVYWQSLDYKVKKSPLAVVDIKFYSFESKEIP